MTIPIVHNNVIDKYFGNKLINPSQYFFPNDSFSDPYCDHAEWRWSSYHDNSSVLKVRLMVVSGDLTSGGLNGIYSNPVPSSVIYKPSNNGEPTGLILNENGIYIVSPPFPFLNTEYRPQFLLWPRSHNEKVIFEDIFYRAIHEFGDLYALVARKGFFRGTQNNHIRSFFDV